MTQRLSAETQDDGSATVDVCVEFFGVPRLRAGVATCAVQARTAGDAMRAVSVELPTLSRDVLANGWVAPAFLLSLNGERFVTDRNIKLCPGDRLILLAADAGG